jgi:hypothetical protein
LHQEINDLSWSEPGREVNASQEGVKLLEKAIEEKRK